MEKTSRCAKSVIGAVAGFLFGIGMVFLLDFRTENTTPPKTPELQATVRIPESTPQVTELVKLSGGALLDRLEVLDSAQLKQVIRNCTVGDLLDPLRVAVMRNALEILAARDPAKFLHWIEGGQVPVAIAKSAIETAATILAGSKSIDSILSIPGGSYSQAQSIALAAYGAALADVDPKLAVRQMIAAGQPYLASWIVGSSWAARDPVAAADYFASLQNDNRIVMQLGMRTVFSRWVHEDPEAARAWVAAQPDKFIQANGLTALFQSLSVDTSMAGTALQYLSEMQDDSARSLKTGQIAQDIGNAYKATHDRSILEQVMAIRRPMERETMLSRMASGISGEVAGEIINELSGQTLRTSALEGAMIFAENLNQGFATIEALQSPADRIAARSKLFEQRSRNPSEAAQIVFASEYPKEREQLLNSFASSLLPPDGKPTDLSWVEQLLPSQRQEVKSAVENWASEHKVKVPDQLRTAL
ncbi:MAG: hypothetical protein R3F19_16630 [Verrucomicrobiales bacterium]